MRGSDAHAPDPAEPTLGTLSVPVSPSPTVSSLTILVGHGVCLSRALAWVVGARERAGPAATGRGSRSPWASPSVRTARGAALRTPLSFFDSSSRALARPARKKEILSGARRRPDRSALRPSAQRHSAQGQARLSGQRTRPPAGFACKGRNVNEGQNGSRSSLRSLCRPTSTHAAFLNQSPNLHASAAQPAHVHVHIMCARCAMQLMV